MDHEVYEAHSTPAADSKEELNPTHNAGPEHRGSGIKHRPVLQHLCLTCHCSEVTHTAVMKVIIFFALVALSTAAPSPFFFSSPGVVFPIAGQFPVSGVFPTTYSVSSSVVPSSEFIAPSSFVSQPVSYSTPVVYSTGVVSNSVEPQFVDSNAVHSQFFDSSVIQPQIDSNSFDSGVVQPQIFDSAVPQTYSGSDLPAGYVAKTRGVTHQAPLPEGLGYASYHINVKPAPGTN
ncbi:Adult cuticle protein 1 [Trinorchestia longiramus]|nr:Adult cuticle protein 1 [Trinorchestia longiramus]